MKVVIDNKIPYIREAMAELADEVIYLPGKEFTPEIVKDADALITRTRTICNRIPADICLLGSTVIASLISMTHGIFNVFFR